MHAASLVILDNYSSEATRRMFNWPSTKKSVAMGTEIAAIIMEIVPNDPVMAQSKRMSKANYVNEKMQRRTRRSMREEALGVLKTAKLLITPTLAFKDSGYDKECADGLVSWVFIGLRTQNI